MSANQNDPQYKLRWSSELREKIAESAKAHNRSMNADIVARLEQSFKPTTDDDKDKLIETQRQVIENALTRINDILSTHVSAFLTDNKKAP